MMIFKKAHQDADMLIQFSHHSNVRLVNMDDLLFFYLIDKNLKQ